MSDASVNLHAHIRLGRSPGDYMPVRIQFLPDKIIVQHKEEYVVEKAEVRELLFLRGSFLADIRIFRSCEWAESPIRLAPLLLQGNRILEFAQQHGYPVEIRPAPFISEEDPFAE